ncbi:MAG: GNAT family N-acetyltransferase [Clostridia bacterium]|nr:GNAT family N-acetyltransferase [Clostridia bacterium]
MSGTGEVSRRDALRDGRKEAARVNGVSVRMLTESDELARITDWMYGWWGLREGYTREAVNACMAHSLRVSGLPRTFGLFLGEELIGMYQFTLSDLFVRPDVYPWLANVYIDEKHRGLGFGREMLRSVAGNAASVGLRELYLFTEHTGLYEEFGWEFIGTIDTHLDPREQRLYRLLV